mmetsp:Transcript_25549/g.60212  ORF Transcript_25549/g.60212 Transcript_25549/m.60212 type:complete len:370 (-) Transcript_25549:152-1261(-)|eukprot:CAMPEP_0172401912 /NCGR_PEP_ID=MMETSP1061-20121228/52496_1 /TAXON_ID=37318 /ORGANISM="Pseudo-nitzschia pungens, Strain cf. pungens" /LENGTH=369 /DNA_ID=CAMNT_0013135725 /DNA_START=218 /DNA_END=1327 /DNA_ORIENTATION=+
MNTNDQSNRNLFNVNAPAANSSIKNRYQRREDSTTCEKKDYYVRAVRVRINARRALYYQLLGGSKGHAKQDTGEWITGQFQRAFTEHSRDLNNGCGNPKSKHDTPNANVITMVDSPGKRSDDTREKIAMGQTTKTLQATPRVVSKSKLATATPVAPTASLTRDSAVSRRERESYLCSHSLPRKSSSDSYCSLATSPHSTASKYGITSIRNTEARANTTNMASKKPTVSLGRFSFSTADTNNIGQSRESSRFGVEPPPHYHNHHQNQQTRRAKANPPSHSSVPVRLHHGPRHDTHPRRQYGSLMREHHHQRLWLLQQQRREREQEKQRAKALASRLFGSSNAVRQPHRTVARAPSGCSAVKFSKTCNSGH